MPGAAGQLKAAYQAILDTAFSSSVTEDIDGTVLERLEYIANRSGAGSQVPVLLSTHSVEAIGTQLGARSAAAPVSATWPTTNLALAIPFVLHTTVTVVKMFLYNGATVSGNFDIGIYNESWARQVASGSTAQAGTSAVQEVNTADTQLVAGRYYLALNFDNTTATVFRSITAAPYNAMIGMAQQAVGAVTLPNPFVPALIATDFVPLCGLSLRTLVA